jgi:hypothetical protein
LSASISHSGKYTQRAWSRFVADFGRRSRSPAWWTFARSD